VHVDGLVIPVGLVPHLGQQLLPGHHHAGPGGQIREQVELAAREVKRGPVQRRLAAGEVDPEAARADHRGRAARAGPAQLRADAGGQVLAGERLDQVVVGPGVEQPNDLGLLVAGGGDDDRGRGDRPHHLQRLLAVQVGQPEVEHDHLGRMAADLPDPVQGGACRPHGVRPLDEVGGDRRPYRGIVFDDEHAGHVGTLCTDSATCGIIADMTRVLTGLAAWLAGTALAVCLAWFGANMVVRDAAASPGVPVINADPPASAAVPSAPPTAPAPLVTPATASASRRPGGTGAAPSPRPSGTQRAPGTPTASVTAPSTTASGPSPSATGAGGVRSYTLDGGRVALQVSADSATLVTAVPDSGFRVETWSGTDWLRVDFSSGAQVSSLIASWYQHAPTITVTN
jgi:hypothetical protein